MHDLNLIPHFAALFYRLNYRLNYRLIRRLICHTVWIVIFGLYARSIAYAAADYPHMKILLQSSQTIAGEPLVYPQSAPATITSAIITIPPGQSTGWHKHTMPLVAYLFAGELEMEYATGKRVRFGKGEALLEAISVPHIGANMGTEPAQLFVAFLGSDHTDFTQAVAAPAVPPHSAEATAQVDLVDLAAFNTELQLDIRYASANNFMKKPLYPIARALLQRPAAEALGKAQQRLRSSGYGIKVLDAYRPWQITREMWDHAPASRAYLADPLQGSRHNRGCAVDITLYDVNTGQEVEMPSAYDDFSERAHPDYQGGTIEQRNARDLLRKAMEAEGFSVYPNEWWHFDYQGWQAYPVLNQPL